MRSFSELTPVDMVCRTTTYQIRARMMRQNRVKESGRFRPREVSRPSALGDNATPIWWLRRVLAFGKSSKQQRNWQDSGRRVLLPRHWANLRLLFRMCPCCIRWVSGDSTVDAYGKELAKRAGRFRENLNRVRSLVAASASMTKEARDTGDDILRAAIVLLHATLEDMLRYIACIYTSTHEGEPLEHIPLASFMKHMSGDSAQ